MTDPTAATLAALESGEPIGWQVVDPDGNVVDSGPLIELEIVAGYGEEAS